MPFHALSCLFLHVHAIFLGTRVVGPTVCREPSMEGHPGSAPCTQIDKLRFLEVFNLMVVTASGRGAYSWVPPPSGLSQNCWTSSSSYSLVVVKVLVNRLCRLLREVLISVLVLLVREVELLLGVSFILLEDLVERHVLSLL